MPQARKRKAPKTNLIDENLGNSVNLVKAQNKLIGDIANNDLYASDEGFMDDGFNNMGLAGGNRGGEYDDYRN